MADIPGQILPIVDEKRLADPIWYEWFTYLRGIAKSVVSLLAFQTNVEGAWTAFTPTFTASGGGVAPTCSPVTCRYKQTGKTVAVFYDFTVTAVGSGGFIRATLPVATTGVFVITGREMAAVGAMMSLSGLASPYFAVYYNNATTLGVGVRHVFSGIYEVI